MAKILLAPTFVTLSIDEALVVDGGNRDFSRYDGYIDTIPVLYHTDVEVKPQTELLPVQPTRVDVGNNPSEIRPEFGNIFGQHDWSEGALQELYHQEGGSSRRYFSSEGFDPTVRGELRHLNETVKDTDVLFTDPGAATQALGLPFVIQGNRVMVGDGAWEQNWTAEDPTGGGTDRTLNDITSNGDEVFVAADTDGVWVRDSGGTWTNDYTGATVTVCAWVKDRLMVAAAGAIYEITAGGALPTALETLPSGWTFTDIFESGAFVIACAANAGAGLGRLHVYGLTSDGTAIEKKGSTALPKHDLPKVGLSYLGRTLVGGGRLNSDGGYDPLLYEVNVQEDASVVLALINAGEGASSADLSVTAMESTPDTIVFGWCEGRAGLGAYNLARNAFYFHLVAGNQSAARVNGVVYIDGRLLFSVDGAGLWYETPGSPVLTAELVSSIADWNNVGFKIWDLIEIIHDPLVVGQTVALQYTKKHPDENDWENGLLSDVSGSQGDEERLSEVFSRRVALKVVSTANSQDDAPVVRGYGFRSLPAPSRPEWVLVRTIRLLDKDRKNPRGEAIKIDPRARRLQLQDLAYTWVTLYEPGVTWEAFVQSVSEVQPVNPIVSETGGTAAKEAFYVRMTMIGRRAA